MDSFGRACWRGDGFTARKCRSVASRRPCSDVRKLLQTSALLPPNGESFGDGCHGEDCSLSKAAPGSDGLESESRPKKLKLKLGGLTHTIHPNFTAESFFNGGSSRLNSSESSVVPQPRAKLLVKGPSTVGANLRNLSGKSFHVYETPHLRTKRIPKRRVMDDEYDVDDSTLDKEIRYLGRLDAPKVFAYHDAGKGERSGIKRRRIYENVDNIVSSKLDKNGRQKPMPALLHDNRNYTEVEHTSDDDDLRYIDSRNESRPPNHGWSLKSGGGHIEYPNGLPALPPKKHKGKLSELEQQVKRAEAAQRRKIQSEKAAREAEEEAIRKILGQDSARKKREEKMKKRNAQQVANGALGPKAIRWINRPAGNVVVFGDDVSLPDIFNSLPCSYPPPREKCAGPDCSNEYKYRDSKLKAPLCSLHCYRAIHQKLEPLTSC